MGLPKDMKKEHDEDESEEHEQDHRELLDIFLHDLSSPLLILNLALDEVEEILGTNLEEATSKARMTHLFKLLRSNSQKLNHLLVDFREKRRGP